MTGRLAGLGERALPDGWRGPSRAAQWRRARARRVLAALLAACALVVAVAVLRPDAPTRPVLVAARDLPVGHRLGSGDLTTAQWPAELAAGAPALAAGEATGRVLASPVRRGEAVSATRVLSSSALPGLGGDRLALSVPGADPALLAMTSPGDRVDVIAADGRVVGRSLLVLGRSLPTEAGLTASAGAGSLTVSVLRAAAGPLVAAMSAGAQGHGVTVALAGR